MSPTLRVRHLHQISVTNITFWHIMMLVTHQNVTNMQKNVINILFFVINILKWSPSLSHKHNDVTNITVTPQSPDCGIDFINGSTKTIYSTEQYYHEAKWSFPVVPYLPIFSPAKSNCQFLPVELSVTRT